MVEGAYGTLGTLLIHDLRHLRRAESFDRLA